MGTGRGGRRFRLMSSSPPPEVRVLADRPDLVSEVGVLRWREWGYGEKSPQSWIDVTTAQAGREALPITLVAIDGVGQAVGAVALGDIDDEMNADERGSRSPWLLGLVVRQQDRHRGIGRLLVTALEQLAAGRCHQRVWVATGGEAVEFYRRCGWTDTQHLRLKATGLPTPVLTRRI